ncbi:MAG: hypothetical protein OXU19_04955 [bacterium]|nr:hypothetical protein [bacterium]MDE0241869.1 hypothetical protein [bacterium]MDE0417548.1 hypothetical protein [bacterium]
MALLKFCAGGIDDPPDGIAMCLGSGAAKATTKEKAFMLSHALSPMIQGMMIAGGAADWPSSGSPNIAAAQVFVLDNVPEKLKK